MHVHSGFSIIFFHSLNDKCLSGNRTANILNTFDSTCKSLSNSIVKFGKCLKINKQNNNYFENL